MVMRTAGAGVFAAVAGGALELEQEIAASDKAKPKIVTVVFIEIRASY
jgi:hypothetical protein